MGIKSLPKPLQRRGCASSQVFCRKLSDKEPCPYPSCAHRHSSPITSLRSVTVGSEGSGEAVGGGFLYLYLSLCKTGSYKGICGTCYSSTPKNDCFLNKVAYLCKQRTETHPTSPEPTVTDRREVKGRGSLTPNPSPKGEGSE